MTYIPGLARLDEGVLSRLATSDVVLVDGTFWRNDELARLGISEAQCTRHGTSAALGSRWVARGACAAERPRKVLVHINNTNPILLEDSPERKVVQGTGVEVAYDGLEIAL